MDQSLPYALDRRAELAGRPCLHVLLIGVSAYHHLCGGADESPHAAALRLGQLEAPALTAAKLYGWLLRAEQDGRLPFPLGSVTLLLAPSPAEQASVAEILGTARWGPPTRAGVERAVSRLRDDIVAGERAAAQAGPDRGGGIGLYYFGGHGIDGGRDDPIILTADVLGPDETQLGANALCQADVATMLTQFEPADGGGRTSAERAALLLVCDCCREDLAGGSGNAAGQVQSAEIRRPPPFADPSGRHAGRSAPPNEPRNYRTLWATAPRLPASELTVLLAPFAPHGRPLTALGHLLLTCLDWTSEENGDPGSDLPLRLTSSKLAEYVAASWLQLAALLEQLGGSLDGKPETHSSGTEFSVCYGRAQPQVPIRLSCDPEDLKRSLSVSIRHDGMSRGELAAPWTQHPESIRLAPNVFQVTAAVPGASAFCRRVTVGPALTEWAWEFGHDQLKVRGPGGRPVQSVGPCPHRSASA